MMPILSSPFQIINSTPPVTKCFTAGTLVLSLVYLWLRARDDRQHAAPYLVVVPGISIFYPWTFLTSAAVETSVIELFFSLVFVPAALRYFERLWGTVETIRFIIITVAIPNLISFGLNWIEYVVLRDADLFLYGMAYYGQMALQAGLLVAATQIIAEHRVQLFGVMSVRVKRLPMTYVGLSNVMVILGYQAPWINIQWGWLVAWAYLRFYKRNKGDSIVSESYGDRSETFAFVQWFPPFIHYPVSLICDTVYAIFTKLHLLPGTGTDLESGSYAAVPGGARAEAERRRTLALKALDQRLASAAAPPATHSGAHNDSSSSSPHPPRPPPTAALSLGNGSGILNGKRGNDKNPNAPENFAEIANTIKVKGEDE